MVDNVSFEVSDESSLEESFDDYNEDRHGVKSLSSSAPSVRAAGGAGAPAAGAGGESDGKAPSKARQKKFHRNFPQVGPDERVLNYYSCALVGDILLQGHLYITKNYFAFYSNVFGYVTKLLIPTASVLRVSKEKMARIIPNAVGVCTRDERHVFASLLSRDATYKLMTRVWKAAGAPAPPAPPPPLELPISEVDLDASEYSPEDESSSGGAESGAAPRGLRVRRDADSLLGTGPAAVIQPALLTGAAGVASAAAGGRTRGGGAARALFLCAAVLLALSALALAHRLRMRSFPQTEVSRLARLSGAELYGELASRRARLHNRAASELRAALAADLTLLAKVRQSLEVLSNVLLTDIAHSSADPLTFSPARSPGS